MAIMTKRSLIRPTSPSAHGNNSSISSKLLHFNKISPNQADKNNNEENSSANFLRTGDNCCGGGLEYLNLAGHVTNFVDNEASLDFLSHSNIAAHNESEPLAKHE
jgi:hypothetical protein